MTDARERIQRLLTGRFDFQPPVVFPMVVANHAARIAGEKLVNCLTDSRKLTAVLYDAYRRYQYDLIMVFADVLIEAEAMGGQVEFFDDEPPVLRQPAGTKASPVPPESARMGIILAATRQLVQQTEARVVVLTSLKGPFSLAAFLLGPEPFLESLLVAPKRATRYLRLATENQKAFARAIVGAGGIPFIGDPMASGSVISPTIFTRFALPFLGELIATIHSLGVWTGLHICGDTSRMLPLLKQTGADILSIDEMDLSTVRRELGPETVIMGNVATDVLATGTTAAVRKAAARCLRQGLPALLLASACDVPAEAPVANVQALVETARNWPEV